MEKQLRPRRIAMNDIKKIMHYLEHIPGILKNLIASIPKELLKMQRDPGK